jgi:flavin-dependent dehydrogenase
MGAGFAGLLAARVLADRFERVLVLERDALPDRPGPRPGVPQGRHLHTLMPGGLELAEHYLPGLGDDLEARGAVRLRFGQDMTIIRPEGRSYMAAAFRAEPLVTGIEYFAMSRDLLEYAVRARVEGLPGVEVRGGGTVRGPRTVDGGVAGVVLDGGEEIAADLVVDAAGRPGRSLAWLADLGFEPPAESVVHCDFAYASAVLAPSDPDALPGFGVLVLPDPAGATPGRGGYVTRIEGGRWLAGLGGRLGDHPPADPSAWREFGRTLASPDWDELVGTARVVDGPTAFRFPSSVRRHLEQLERFPEGLVPLGDALCHVNPLYGHGMSSAAGQVRALEQVLEGRDRRSGNLDGLAREFFPGAFEVTRAPWAVAAGSDFLSSGTTGDFPDEEFANLMRLVQLGSLIDGDADAAALFVDLLSLRRPWSALEESPWRERLSPESTGVGATAGS